MEFKPLEVKRFPAVAGRKTADYRYWKSFKEHGAVNAIDMAATGDFAVACSTRINIYDVSSVAIRRSMARFKDIVHCVNLRKDGKLVAAGDASGLIQLFDINSRAILRSLRGHKDAVHVVRFLPNNTNVLSAGDDKLVKVWDLAGESVINEWNDHSDYVRAAVASSLNPNIVVSGSYDHTIKMYDLRSKHYVMSMNHGSSVNSLVYLPGEGMLASAGSNLVKIWDIVGGGRLVSSLSNHQKTIMNLCLDGKGTRLLTGGLDHSVKVYNLEDFTVVHSMKYPAPVSNVVVSHDDGALVVGMTDGSLSVRKRAITSDEVNERETEKEALKHGTYKYFTRGASAKPREDDVVVEASKKRKVKTIDRLFKTFKYSDALDHVLKTNQSPVTVFSVLEELVHRNGLEIALGGRDENQLEPIVRYLLKNINNPRFSRMLSVITMVILDMYGRVMGQSALIESLLSKLKAKVTEELQTQRQIQNLLGMMDTIMDISVRL